MNAIVSFGIVFYSNAKRSESRVAFVVSATSCVKVPVVKDTAYVIPRSIEIYELEEKGFNMFYIVEMPSRKDP